MRNIHEFFMVNLPYHNEYHIFRLTSRFSGPTFAT